MADVDAAGIPIFSIDAMKAATNGFADRIGIGTTATTYRGTLPDGRLAAFKVLRQQTRSQEQLNLPDPKFQQEVQTLYRLQNRHLANFLGYHMGDAGRAFVFEYVPGGSLYDRLHETRSAAEKLTWAERLRIAVGIACGLDYLHSEAEPGVAHMDLKSGNVLLTQDGAAKVHLTRHPRLVRRAEGARTRTRVAWSEASLPAASARALRGQPTTYTRTSFLACE
eukprot:jgi/Mesen1/771/ME000110S_11037